VPSDHLDGEASPDYTLRRLQSREWDGSSTIVGGRHELVLHVGDIVYADYGINTSTNVAWWDLFGTQIEFMAAGRPYMICPGNHDLHERTDEHRQPTGDLESLRYNARYRMPGVYWYSFNHRNVHFVSISTEHDLAPGSPQHEWLEADLRAADASRTQQPWVILYGHKPPVCSHEQLCGEAYVPLDLLARYHVDAALWGHVHAYERTYPLVNFSMATTGVSYREPRGTPHVMLGMAGDGMCCGRWTFNQPLWSAFREDSFGFVRVVVESNHAMRLEYVRNDNGRIQDSFSVGKGNQLLPQDLWGEGIHDEATIDHPQKERSRLGHRPEYPTWHPKCQQGHAFYKPHS